MSSSRALYNCFVYYRKDWWNSECDSCSDGNIAKKFLLQTVCRKWRLFQGNGTELWFPAHRDRAAVRLKWSWHLCGLFVDTNCPVLDSDFFVLLYTYYIIVEGIWEFLVWLNCGAKLWDTTARKRKYCRRARKEANDPKILAWIAEVKTIRSFISWRNLT